MLVSSTKLLNQSNDTAGGDRLNLFDTRIIGGKEATEDRHPYSVSLKDSFHFCGGSLILKDVVLTAAHCINGDNFDVLVGRHDYDDNDGELVSVRKTITHPNYDADTSSYDVALVFLSTPVQDENIQLMRLNNDDSYPQPGTMAHVMGWGDVNPGSSLETVDELHIVSVDVISNEECETITKDGQNYEGQIYDNMMCTSTEGQDACQGDSGGPLIVRGNNAANDMQIGVVSWGIGCAYLPGVFSRVSIVYDWIQDNACKRSRYKSGSTLCGTTQAITDETQPPSSSPSAKPSLPPTNEPSPRPSQSPTNSPTTLFPTIAPSPLPTSSPSFTSSDNPSLQPSESPSLSLQPSASPTSSPSSSPSKHPTSRPSVSPSISSSPSGNPSLEPTPVPSVEPSVEPSALPSASQSPSRTPTWQPSKMPSSHPTAFPSARPSASPSEKPSNSPTLSLQPSPKPSVQPSDFPSGIPSLTPSDSPSSSSAPTLSLEPTNANYGRLRQDEIGIKVYGLRDPLIMSSEALSPEDFHSNSSSRLGKSTLVLSLMSATVSTLLLLIR